MALEVTFCVGALALALTLLLIRVLKVGSRSPGLPPGPPTIPLLGNIHIFPIKSTHRKLAEWSEAYGGIYSLMLGPKPLIVIGDPRIAHDLLVQRSATTSGRQSLQLAHDITGGLTIAVMPYGPLLKDFRRTMKDFLSREACLNHVPIQTAESRQLMYDLLKDPEHYHTHTERFSSSVILSAAFGLRAPRYHDSLVERFFKVLRSFESILEPGGAPPVDIFPFLNRIPERWAGWKRRAKSIAAAQYSMWGSLADLCKRRINEDRRLGCFIEHVYDNSEKYNLLDREIAYLGGNLLEAGSDTTSVFLQSFMALMVNHPEVQERAQREIDTVIGSARAPVYEDFASLSYLQAVIKEVHRFRPATPHSIPHVTTEDVIVEEYLIPKDTLILPSMWAMNRDASLFDHPDLFDPDRFLRTENGTKKGVDDTGLRPDLVFGFGRRICPGLELAINSIRINTMNLLWGFNFHPTKDPESGETLPCEIIDKTHGLLLTHEPFQFDIRPRNQARADIIRAEYTAARDTFALFEEGLSEDERRYVAEY